MSGSNSRSRFLRLPRLSRRTLLHGLGTVAVGLPFLEEMQQVQAQATAPPMRLITLFFGLGMPKEQTMEGFSGPLEPYEPLKDKMAMFRNLELKHAHEYGSGEPHFKVGDVVFVGDPQKRQYEASGPSMEQIAKRALHPNGVPTRIGSKSVGMWFRTGSVSQYTRHWNQDGSPGERPERRPTRIFEQFFGQTQGNPETEPMAIGPDPALVQAQHMRRSVLDSVRGEYEHYSGTRSPLGAVSKAKLSVHLDNIRSVEQQLAPMESAIEDAVVQEGLCLPPASVQDPGDGDVPYDVDQGGAGGSAPVCGYEDFMAAFKLQGELMALALRCDVLRFGSMLFVGSGGHVGLRGSYSALGESIDYSADLGGTSAHDAYFHNNRWNKVRLHQHMAQVALADALKTFDDNLYLEANGKTVLDNTLVVIGTGYGGGGSSIGHVPQGVFHAIAGGNGHFKPGFYDNERNIIDVYHTALHAYGIESGMGSGNHPRFSHTPQLINEVLA